MEMTKTIDIFLCDLTHMGQGIASDSFPLGIGCIAAYLERRDNCIRTRLFKFPDDLDQAFAASFPKIVGFSNYVWNAHLAVTMAKAVKARAPGTVIVFGGPNFPRTQDGQAAFLRDNPVIDFYIEGEGERAFLKLVKKLDEACFDIDRVKREGSPSVRTMHRGRFISRPYELRIKNLDEIPSPYLTGKLDPFFEYGLMPLVQTNRGCPFTCTYCVEGHEYYKRVSKRQNRDILYAELEYIAGRARNNRQMFISDSNFGMYREDVDTARHIGGMMDRYDFPVYIHVATGKNKKERVLEIAGLLKGRLRLSGSVQSLSPTVLKNIRRANISTSQLLSLAREAEKIGANSYFEVILGLPGDNLDRHMATLKGVIDAGFNFALPWTLMILLGSPLEETRRSHGITCRYRVLPRCFGRYEFDDKQLVSGEIEAVCVRHDTMGFEDYLQCREFALTMSLFYNDKVFQEILSLLKMSGMGAFEWLREIHRSRGTVSPELGRIFSGFRESTANELWDSWQELREYLTHPDHIRQFISGELGFNVLNKYRLRAMLTCMPELNDMAFSAFREMARHVGNDIPWEDAFLDQLQHFSLVRKTGLFEFGRAPVHTYGFNFKPIVDPEDNGRAGIGPPGSYSFVFSMDPEKEKLISEQIGVYGDCDAGLTKVVSRIPLWTLFRKPVPRPGRGNK